MLKEDEKWYRVSLRFFGEDLDHAAVTAAVGFEPESTGRKGEHIRGNPRYAVYRTNIWRHSYTEDDTVTFEDQLSDYLTRLEGQGAALLAMTRRPGVRAELFMGFSSGNGQGGFTLSAPLVARIAKLGLDVSLDLYPPRIDED